MEIPTDLPFLATAVAALLIALWVGRMLWRGKSKKRFPPMAGTIFQQLVNFKRLHDFHTDLCRKYRTFRLYAPFNTQVYTADPANVEYFLRTNFKNFGKGLYSYENLKDLFGDGIFAVDGEKWKQQRKLASYEFSTRVLRDFSGGIFKTNAVKLAHIIGERVDSHEEMDIQDLFMKSTMDSIFKIGFGVELNSLKGSEDGTKFSKAFDNSSELITRRYVDAFWKIKKFLSIGHEAELKNHIRIVDDFVYKVINNKIESSSPTQENDPEKKEDLLSRFITEMDKDPQNMTRKYLRDIILNFLIAGKDTTAGTLSWFIYMLCKHPTVQEKIAEEIKASVEIDEDTNYENFANHLTDEVLDKLQYLHATLTETLRLYPSVPMDSKVCFSDDTFPDGFSVQKGDVVTYQPYAMGRMKYLWGDDAEIFRPERWINDGSFQHESPFKFTAFQAGPRICLGKEFAYRQMKIFAAVLLHFFSFKLRSESDIVNYRTMITLYIDQGLHVHALHR